MTEEYDDPFAAEADEQDPFATEDDVKRRNFEKTPTLEALAGRVVVMIPRKFEKDAPIPKEFVKPGEKDTRERYTVDMTVFGGPLEFWYNKKEDGKEDEIVTTVIPADEMPKMFEEVWVTQGNIVGSLKKIDGTARPVLRGVVRRGPKAPDRKAGKKTEDIEKAHAAWVAGGKRGNEPGFAWYIDVAALTAENVDAIKVWWKSANVKL